jgi:hypothetical protein
MDISGAQQALNAQRLITLLLVESYENLTGQRMRETSWNGLIACNSALLKVLSVLSQYAYLWLPCSKRVRSYAHPSLILNSNFSLRYP